MTERVMHWYRVAITVTKKNCKELTREHGKIVCPGDTLSFLMNGNLKPNSTMDKIYRDLANEMGGIAEYQREEITTSDWGVL